VGGGVPVFTATPTVGVLPPHPPSDTPEVVSLEVGCRRDQELEGAKEHKILDRFGLREHNTLRPVWFVLPLMMIG
jgi:hypothetical protein